MAGLSSEGRLAYIHTHKQEAKLLLG